MDLASILLFLPSPVLQAARSTKGITRLSSDERVSIKILDEVKEILIGILLCALKLRVVILVVLWFLLYNINFNIKENLESTLMSTPLLNPVFVYCDLKSEKKNQS